MQYTVKREDETLDEIIYNYYGSSLGYLELVLEANVFLYKEDIFLRKGLILELSDIQKEPQDRISLWN